MQTNKKEIKSTPNNPAYTITTLGIWAFFLDTSPSLCM